MFKGQNKVRVKAICVFQNGSSVFVSRAKDSVKNDYYYRPVGGNVEFGEYTIDTIKREIQEELSTEIENVKLLGVLENIFVCDGFDGHEIVFLYKADFADKSFYEKKDYTILEGTEKFEAMWVDVAEFKSGTLRLVPEKLIEYLL